MARVSAIFNGDCTQLGNARIPLYIDQSLTMVMDMDAEYVTENVCPNKADLDKFVKKYRLLSQEALNAALRIESKDFSALVSQMVPCVGCRRSADILYSQVTASGINAFYPMTVGKDCSFQLDEDKSTIVFLWNLFYTNGKHKQNMMDFLDKAKTGRRCDVHSLEAQRYRAVTSWLDVWEFMDETCQDSCTIIDSKTVTMTLTQYLIKHRFCAECKLQVLKAFYILLGDAEPTAEDGFVPELYDGIETCKKDKHIHVVATTSFVTSLITRCVPELAGSSRRERHAKTMEIAQEEVLICIGLCIFERLHRVQQRFCAEERAWETIMCVGIQALKQSFDLAVDQKMGVSQLELLCAEIEREEKAKVKRKKAKKPKKKNANKVQSTETASAEIQGIGEPVKNCERELPEVQAESNNPSNGSQKSGKKKKGKKGKANKPVELVSDKSVKKAAATDDSISEPSRSSPVTSTADCGYSSGTNIDNPSCSSPEGSETFNSEAFCGLTFQECNTSSEACSSTNPFKVPFILLKPQLNQPYRSLEEQLDACSDLDDDFEGIPEEEVSAIYQPMWQRSREAARLNIRLQFEQLMEAKVRRQLEDKRTAEAQVTQTNILQNTSAKSNARPDQEPLTDINKGNLNGSEEVNDQNSEGADGGKENQKSGRQGGGKKSRQGHGGGQCSRRYKGKNRR